MNAPGSPSDDDATRDFFLPDFCQARAILAIVLISVLVGCVIALARISSPDAFWLELARATGFLLWAGLLSAAALCRVRPWLAGRTLRVAVGASLGLVVGIVALLSEAAYLAGRYSAGPLQLPRGLLPESQVLFVLPNVAIATIVAALAWRYFYVTSQWRRSVEQEAHARIRALQARIRPHFLFNSMNTIAALTRSNPPQAESAIEDLADLFRVSLSDARAQIPLGEELEVARTYQRIEQLRLGDRLQVHWDVDALPMQDVVPSLLLQPLLENAIGHGIEPLPTGGTVHVRGRTDGNSIVLEVANPVAPSHLVRPSRAGHGMALDNIRQRLDLAFPRRSSVEVVDDDGLFVVRLRFPRVGAAVPRSAEATLSAP